MSVMKKFGLGVLFVVLMYFGGLGTQSSNTAMQGAGAVSVLVALVLLFTLFKVTKTNMGTITSFLLFGSITLFIAYSLGWLKNVQTTTQEQVLVENSENSEQNVQYEEEPQEEDEGGFFAKIFGGSSSADNDKGFNPEDYPFVEGYANAVTGAMLEINGLHIKLLGLEAPYMQQTCANKFGQGYACGKVSREWLQNWLQNKMVKCHIISPQNNGRATGVCFSEGYDVGAVIVNAGWAVAYTKNTDIYVPYEQHAGTKKRGLWAGTFYKPWDWKKLQSKKTKITIETNSNNSVSDTIDSSLDSILGAF